MESDWFDDAPHPSSSEEATTLTVDQLPEVKALQDEGWWLAPEAPIFTFLPAVWPRTMRTWVHDRSTHYVREWINYVERPLQPFTEDDWFTVDNIADHSCQMAGFPGSPRRRIWLLQLPPGHCTLKHWTSALLRAAHSAGQPVMASPEFTEFTASFVDQSFSG